MREVQAARYQTGQPIGEGVRSTLAGIYVKCMSLVSPGGLLDSMISSMVVAEQGDLTGRDADARGQLVGKIEALAARVAGAVRFIDERQPPVAGAHL